MIAGHGCDVLVCPFGCLEAKRGPVCLPDPDTPLPAVPGPKQTGNRREGPPDTTASKDVAGHLGSWEELIRGARASSV